MVNQNHRIKNRLVLICHKPVVAYKVKRSFLQDHLRILIDEMKVICFVRELLKLLLVFQVNQTGLASFLDKLLMHTEFVLYRSINDKVYCRCHLHPFNEKIEKALVSKAGRVKLTSWQFGSFFGVNVKTASKENQFIKFTLIVKGAKVFRTK